MHRMRNRITALLSAVALSVTVLVMPAAPASAAARPVDQDLTAPVTTCDAVATYENKAVINLSATDEGSGVKATHFLLDCGT